MNKFNLTIRPAVPVKLRHKISEFLEKEGFNVWAQGEFMDKSVWDINFENPKEPEIIKCDICDNPAHGIYKKKHLKLTRCLYCAPPPTIVIGFKPLNMHLKKH